jgi:hypothetical protein
MVLAAFFEAVSIGVVIPCIALLKGARAAIIL